MSSPPVSAGSSPGLCPANGPRGLPYPMLSKYDLFMICRPCILPNEIVAFVNGMLIWRIFPIDARIWFFGTLSFCVAISESDL